MSIDMVQENYENPQKWGEKRSSAQMLKMCSAKTPYIIFGIWKIIYDKQTIPRPRSTAFLGMLWMLSAQSMPRKAVDSVFDTTRGERLTKKWWRLAGRSDNLRDDMIDDADHCWMVGFGQRLDEGNNAFIPSFLVTQTCQTYTTQYTCTLIIYYMSPICNILVATKTLL